MIQRERSSSGPAISHGERAPRPGEWEWACPGFPQRGSGASQARAAESKAMSPGWSVLGLVWIGLASRCRRAGGEAWEMGGVKSAHRKCRRTVGWGLQGCVLSVICILLHAARSAMAAAVSFLHCAFHVAHRNIVIWWGTPSRDVLKCSISTPVQLTHNTR